MAEDDLHRLLLDDVELHRVLVDVRLLQRAELVGDALPLLRRTYYLYGAAVDEVGQLEGALCLEVGVPRVEGARVGVEDSAVMLERADRVLGFVSFCNREVERINGYFASIRPDFDPEEKMAGIEKLRFGSFGVLDWYARRMGIADQNEVRSVPWVRIWQCMKNDNEQGKYEKRLREVYKRKNQNRKR